MPSPWRRRLVFSLLPLLALVITGELGARVRELWCPPLAVDSGWGFTPGSRVFIQRGDGSFTTHPRKLASFRKQSFAMPKPAGTVRLAMIGGSNVASLDLDTYGARLGPMLDGRQPELLNLGGLAYGSERLVQVTREVLDYDLDLLLIYSGHNELEEQHTKRQVRLSAVPLDRLLSHSALFRSLRDIILRRRIEAWVTTERARLQHPPDTRASRDTPLEPEERAARMVEFRANLERILDLARDAGVPVVIGSVSSNHWNPGLDEPKEGLSRLRSLYQHRRYKEGLELADALLRTEPRHQASSEENDIIRDVAARHQLPLADVEAAIAAAEPHGVPGETLFLDHCHLKAEGMAILLATYEPLILEALEPRQRSSASSPPRAMGW
jgi:hypothetical protein